MTGPQQTLWTAGVLIKVYPTGPGKVRISAESVGRVDLEPHEMLAVLEGAVETMRNNEGHWLDPDAN